MTNILAIMDPESLPIYARLGPVFLVFIILEAAWYRRVRRSPYAWRESHASLIVYAGNIASGFAAPLFTGWAWTAAYANRLTTIEMNDAWAWLGLFVGLELAYYWMHRMSHEVRWLWASHSMHHSSTQLNFCAAGRLPWTTFFSGVFLFWLPLVWLGFPPSSIGVMLGMNLSYQFFIHTEVVPKLGPLEWVLNTPSHHRVHHATNPAYVDRNYGGFLIIFDRLFGTFAQEQMSDPCRYGLVKPVRTLNPVKIALHEWGCLIRDLWHARSWRERLGYAFGPPGWSRDGPRLTIETLRAANIGCRTRTGEPASQPASVRHPATAVTRAD